MDWVIRQPRCSGLSSVISFTFGRAVARFPATFAAIVQTMWFVTPLGTYITVVHFIVAAWGIGIRN